MFPADNVNAAAKDASKTENQAISSGEQKKAATITETNAIIAFIGRIILKAAIIFSFT